MFMSYVQYWTLILIPIWFLLTWLLHFAFWEHSTLSVSFFQFLSFFFKKIHTQLKQISELGIFPNTPIVALPVLAALNSINLTLHKAQWWVVKSSVKSQRLLTYKCSRSSMVSFLLFTVISGNSLLYQLLVQCAM